jgi:hypothetical protein
MATRTKKQIMLAAKYPTGLQVIRYHGRAATDQDTRQCNGVGYNQRRRIAKKITHISRTDCLKRL